MDNLTSSKEYKDCINLKERT